MCTTRLYNRLLVLALVVSQFFASINVRAGDEPDSEPQDDPIVTTDSGRSGRELPWEIRAAHVGDIVQDPQGNEWLVTGIDKLNGKTFYWLDLHDKPPSNFSMGSLPKTKEIEIELKLPRLDPMLPTDWSRRVGRLEAPSDLPNFDGARFSGQLERELGVEGFGRWTKDVEGFLDEATTKSIAQQSSSDVETRAVPFPELAPVPYRTIPPITEQYIGTIDRELGKALSKLEKINSNLIAYTVLKTSSEVENGSWECPGCEQLSTTPNFADETSKAARRAIGDVGALGSPYRTGEESPSDVIKHNFTTPEGTARQDLKHIYNKLAHASPASPQGKTAKAIGFSALAAADRASQKGNTNGFEQYKSIAATMADIALGFTPLGTARDIYESIAGHSFLDGHELSGFERSMAIVGAVAGLTTVGAGSGAAKSTMRSAARIVELAKTTRLGAATAERAGRLASLALSVGARTKEELRTLIKNLSRSHAGEGGAIAEAEVARTLQKASQFGARTPVGVQIYAKIKGALEKLPPVFDIKIIHEGNDPSKIAIIGRKMGGEDGVLGVRDVAKVLREEARVSPSIFEPSEEALELFTAEVKKHRRLTGNENAMLPDSKVTTTKMFSENAEWAKKLKEDGYTFIDSGNPSGETVPSIFYETEKGTLRGGK